MNFYFAMVNAWSLAWEALNGTMDDTYPMREDVPESLWGKEIPDRDITITSRESDELQIVRKFSTADLSDWQMGWWGQDWRSVV